MSQGWGTENASNRVDHTVGRLCCVECGSLSSLDASGWRAYRTDEPFTEDLPTIALYCPSCAAREFG